MYTCSQDVILGSRLWYEQHKVPLSPIPILPLELCGTGIITRMHMKLDVAPEKELLETRDDLVGFETS